MFLFSSDVQVLTEQVLLTREGMVGTGKVQRTREEAAASFTQHFADLARQKPVFRKLQTLFDLVLLARLWQEKGLHSDLLDRLCALPYRSVTVPDSYAGIKEDVISNPSFSFWLVGGVEMRLSAGRRSWLVLETEETTALRKKVQGLRFADGPAAALENLTLQAPIPTRNPRRETAALAVQAALSGGDLKAAFQAADQLVAADPWDDHSLILRALVHLRRANYVQARGDAERARMLDPGNPETDAAAGEILFQCRWMEGDPEGALRETEARLRHDPHSANAEIARAEALALLDKSDEARKALLRAVELDPTSALACAASPSWNSARGGPWTPSRGSRKPRPSIRIWPRSASPPRSGSWRPSAPIWPRRSARGLGEGSQRPDGPPPGSRRPGRRVRLAREVERRGQVRRPDGPIERGQSRSARGRRRNRLHLGRTPAGQTVPREGGAAFAQSSARPETPCQDGRLGSAEFKCQAGPPPAAIRHTCSRTPPPPGV